MNQPLIFLDIDGVLNNHIPNIDSDCCGIDISRANYLNHILKETNANLVICSAWRYMIIGKAMTIKGFEYLLRTHGVNAKDKIEGITPSDEEFLWRGHQISCYLDKNKIKPRKYCVLDDRDDEITISGHPLVRTNGEVGLTMEDANKVIEILK
jgi:hypothetical protein